MEGIIPSGCGHQLILLLKKGTVGHAARAEFISVRHAPRPTASPSSTAVQARENNINIILNDSVIN